MILTIDKLESVLSEIEAKMEEDDEFTLGDVFYSLYEKLPPLFDEVEAEINSFPYDTANEKQFEKFDIFRQRFEVCKRRKKNIEDDSDMEDGDDDWMFDRDKDEPIEL